MTRHIPPYLKLAGDREAARPDLADLACLGELCQAFADATGWPLRYVPEAQTESSEDVDLLWSAPVNPGVGVAPGHLRIDLSGSAAVDDGARADWHAAERMAGAIAELVNELVAARHALWQREAELAAGVPVTPHSAEEAHLAARLEATLQAGARAIGCDSAALYLLDEATSQLKLRAAWGLPIDKFIQPARPLAQQLADLEALLGHAIALESRGDMVGRWIPPEAAAAALCVPVSSPTIPLGTVWFFCDRERAFSDDQTNIAEVIAGKIASDLDRAVLLENRTSQKDFASQVAAASRMQEHQLPVAPPPLAGWSIHGWAEQAGPLGGAFYDWRMIDDSSLLVMVGDACDDGVEAALASSALRAALRIDDEQFDLERLLSHANRILWENAAGNWWAGLWLAAIRLDDGRCDFSAFGRPAAMLLQAKGAQPAGSGGTAARKGAAANQRSSANRGARADRSAAAGWASLLKPSEPLGLEPVIKPAKKQLILSPGESLVVCNRGVIETSGEDGRPLSEATIARALLKNLNSPPERMIDLVRELLVSQDSQIERDRSVLVVKRLRE